MFVHLIVYIIVIFPLIVVSIELDPSIVDLEYAIPVYKNNLHEFHDFAEASKDNYFLSHKQLNTRSVVLEDSIPIKDSIQYGSSLQYSFVPNNNSESTHSFEILVFISASLCKLPLNWNLNSSYNGLNLYYTFNQTIATLGDIDKMNVARFENGYAQGLARTQIVDNEYAADILYVEVLSDECGNCTTDSSWVFELGISQKNLLFLYDIDPIVSVVDVDYNSVIFDAEEVALGNNKSFGLYIFDGSTSPMHVALNQSWCAVSDTQNYVQWIGINDTTASGNKNRFVLEGLDMGTQYSAVLVVTYTDMPYGGGVFQVFNFSTASSQACKLIYNLNFCNEIAYAVPVSTNFSEGIGDSNTLAEIYDNYARGLYQGFEYALQQEACDTELDARFSPVRTCDDCRYSYKQWLCGVSIPRCSQADGTEKYHKFYNASEGRNSFIADMIIPPLSYSEVLPCLNMCQSIVRDCPPSFGFQCPESEQYITLSYGDPSLLKVDEIADYRICNYMGDKNKNSNSSSKLSLSPLVWSLWLLFGLLYSLL